MVTVYPTIACEILGTANPFPVPPMASSSFGAEASHRGSAYHTSMSSEQQLFRNLTIIHFDEGITYKSTKSNWCLLTTLWVPLCQNYALTTRRSSSPAPAEGWENHMPPSSALGAPTSSSTILEARSRGKANRQRYSRCLIPLAPRWT